MTALKFLEKVSPNQSVGIRADLADHKLLNPICKIMEKFAEESNKELREENTALRQDFNNRYDYYEKKISILNTIALSDKEEITKLKEVNETAYQSAKLYAQRFDDADNEIRKLESEKSELKAKLEVAENLISEVKKYTNDPLIFDRVEKYLNNK